MKKILLLLFALYIIIPTYSISIIDNDKYRVLYKNAIQANEAFYRSNKLVKGWINYCDSITGLIPRNLLGDNYWNAQDAAADNYPFMVLTTFFTDQNMFNGKMKEMLEAEIKYTSRLGACPATYDFEKQNFRDSIVNVGNVIFGSAEYMKDGLLPLTEWLGKSLWSDRMISILNDLKLLIPDYVVTNIDGDYYGGVPEIEVNGDLLQILSRMYWMTGNRSYLDWAIKIGDYYLLINRNNIDLSYKLRLRDHGGEIVLGLCELYATLNFVDKDKKEEYQKPLYRLMDKILECGRNEHGMFYDEINPQKCTVLSSSIADTWGYILDGFYTIYMIDNHVPYKDATLLVHNNLRKFYQYYNWERESSDGLADAIEGAINLLNRERITSVEEWIDDEIEAMFRKQRDNGVIEGWHGDGNFARTSIMYALWKTQGCYINNWHKDILFGAEREEDKLNIIFIALDSWTGKLFFDKKRHRLNLNLPIDWTRINQFPEWFTIDPQGYYSVSINESTSKVKGEKLLEGLSLSLKKGEKIVLKIIKD